MSGHERQYDRGGRHPLALLPDHALGMLRGLPRRRVERHLSGCASCRAEVAALRGAADSLAWAPPPATPPPLDRLVAALPPQDASRPRLTERPARAARAWRPVLAVAAAVVMALSLGFNVVLWSRASRAEMLFADAATVRLAGTEAAHSASARLVPSLDGRQVTLSVVGLPVLSSDRQYQLWLIQEGVRTSGAVFTVDELGCGIYALRPPRSLRSYSGFGVTIEPAGGSPGPTGPRVLFASR
jgi:anti-sigma-K factor RskA